MTNLGKDAQVFQSVNADKSNQCLSINFCSDIEHSFKVNNSSQMQAWEIISNKLTLPSNIPVRSSQLNYTISQLLAWETNTTTSLEFKLIEHELRKSQLLGLQILAF